jgi:hypothetical protein
MSSPFPDSCPRRYLPTVSWNIDSFGHTTGNSGLVLGLNYSSQVLNRVSYDIKSLLQEHALHSFEYFPELLSQKFHLVAASSPTKKSSMSLTTSILPFHYSSPGSTDQLLRSPHLSNSKRLQIQSSLLLTLSRQLGDCVELGTRDCDLMILLGNDMTYAGYAPIAYHNLDSVISSLNDIFGHSHRHNPSAPSLRGLIDRNRFTLDVFYSTPKKYFASKTSQIQSSSQTERVKVGAGAGATVTNPTKNFQGMGHFVPYSDSLLNDWTGFYGTRPLLKEKIRYDFFLSLSTFHW